MKESSFYSDEFEQLIREKTEQYKMYPSENVWKGVHNSLHTKRKWFIGSMAFLVTGILFFSGKELLAPGHSSTHKLAAAGSAPTDSFNSDPTRSTQPEDNSHANFVRVHPVNAAASSGRHLNALVITISHPVVSQPDLSELLSHAVRLPGETPSLIETDKTPVVAMTKPAENPKTEPGLLDSWLVRNAPENTAAHKNADVATIRNTNPETLRETPESIPRETTDDAYVRGVIENLSARGQQRILTAGQISYTSSPRQRPVTSKIKDSSGTAKASPEAIGEVSDLSRVNWLHDYAVYSLPPSPSRGRLFFQLVLAPTVNYRSLSGGSMASSKELGGGSGMHTGNLLTWADQSPALGFEFGANVLYRVTRNLTVKAGMQFNYSHYKMQAYTSPQQQQQQSQQTESYRSPLGNLIFLDSMAQTTPTTGTNPYVSTSIQATLYNDYYQLSAPIGFDLRVLGNERLQFNLGATIQPNYLLNTDSYILSSDYTSYSKEPSAFRRWNVTGAVEAFLSYQTGLIRWQIGPEFRYQLFSNYLSGNPYPISENLKGYGIKFGIIKPLP